MIKNIIRFIRLDLIVVLALFTGTLFGIWIGFDPTKLSAAAYIEQQQNAIRSLGPVMPTLAGISLLLSLTLAIATKHDPRTRYLLIASAGCVVAVALITRFVNQPINAEVMTWSIDAPAANWIQLRERWWSGHIARTIAAIAGLGLAALALLGSSNPSSEP